MIKHSPLWASAVVVCVLLHTGAAMAQDLGAPNLAAQVVDPTAPLKTFILQNRYSPSVWGLDDRQNDLLFQAGIPHVLLNMPNIFRISVPYVTSQPLGERGLGDVEIVDIFLYQKGWGTLALGGVLSAGTNKGPGVDTLSVGPAIAAVFRKNKWTYGVFNQNFFSFGDISRTQIQPILAYTLNERVSFAIGDAQYAVDWNEGKIINVPLSAQINYIARVHSQPVRFFFNSQYNAVNEPGTRKWTLSIGAAVIVK
ncbi:MAG TPA: hypothetical protein VFR18_06205 [Terriglobia bacterium]|nr:hypothetical protein [Terriglobia bacterium]